MIGGDTFSFMLQIICNQGLFTSQDDADLAETYMAQIKQVSREAWLRKTASLGWKVVMVERFVP
jgi:hypothetical protein